MIWTMPRVLLRRAWLLEAQHMVQGSDVWEASMGDGGWGGDDNVRGAKASYVHIHKCAASDFLPYARRP